MTNPDDEELLERIRELEDRLVEAQETLHALKTGAVDAIVVSGGNGDRVYTLRGADEGYRALVEDMAEGALTVAPDGLILFSNEQFAAMVQTPLERVIGAQIQDFVQPGDGEVLQALVRHGLQSRVQGEVWLKGQDGAAVPAYLSANRFDTAGLECVCLMVTDLSEQKRNQQIVEAEKLASSILEQAAQAIVVVDPEGRIIRASRAAHRLAGTNVLLRPFDAIFRLRFEGTEYSLSRILAMKPANDVIEGVESTAVMPGGMAQVVLSAAALAGSHGEPLGSVITLMDITGRKRAEEALRESESRERARSAELEAILDAVPAAIVIARDSACEHVIGSRTAYELLGLPPGSNLSLSAPGIEPQGVRLMRQDQEIPPEELPLQKAAATGRPVRNYEFDVVSPDGTRRSLLGEAVPMMDENGGTRGAVGAFLDITDRKRSEDHLRHAQKLESLGLLAGGIAHDFNNLLAGILGYASLLREETSCEGRKKVDSILSASERAANLSRQLLAYAGKGRHVVEHVDFSKLVCQITELLHASVPKKVQLRENLEADLPPVDADRGQLQQIVMNLVLNAAEAIPEGHAGAVFVHTSLEEVTASQRIADDISGEVLAPGKYVCLEVRDTGTGMDAQTKAKIFEPFFSTKFEGRGLGLAAAAGAVKKHRGAIQVASGAGAGTTFRVFFPAAASQAQTDEVDRAGELRGSGTVLVADDEPMVRALARDVLEQFGYKVLTAKNGREAIRVFRKHSREIGVVLLDLTMPVMSGTQALEALREKCPDVKVILMSGYGETEAVGLFVGKGVSSFLQKPFTAMTLAEQVKSLLASEREHRAGGGA